MNFLLLLTLLLSFNLFANSKVGIIIKKQGDVELLTNPSKKFDNNKGTILYEGVYYQRKKARRGLKLKNGDILKTGSNSKARIVYKNGDQINVGEGTAFAISWEKPKSKKDESKSTISLINGAIRGVVSKKGPRSKLTVKSRTAVMGVRGTDFHFSQKGTSGKTKISVLRGQVEVAKSTRPDDKVDVKQGFSAEVEGELLSKKTKNKAPLATLAVDKTTQQDLVEIQKDSKIIKEDKEDISPVVKEELSKLEAKAIETTLDDIKEYQPDVYKNLAGKKITTVDTVNTVVVTKAIKKAPPQKSKKGFDEMGINLEEDTYKKYFDIKDSL